MASFTISEREPGCWNASYFRDQWSRGFDQGIREPSLVEALAQVRTTAEVFHMPFDVIRVRNNAGEWSQVTP